jgi:hypothetical protein
LIGDPGNGVRERVKHLPPAAPKSGLVTVLRRSLER